MTDRYPVALEELPTTPEVGLVGPRRAGAVGDLGLWLGEDLNRGAAGPPPVDGVAVLFFDPTTSDPHLVFVSKGLAALLGQTPSDLLGRSPDSLFGPTTGKIEIDALRRALVEPAAEGDERAIAIDLSERGPDRVRVDETDSPPIRHHQSTQILRSGNGGERPVHASYTSLPSMTLGAPYILAEFRDLSRDSAERLLSDQSAVVGSLARGHELGRLCHQMCGLVEDELGDGSACWFGLAGSDGVLKPVVATGLPLAAAAELMSAAIDSGVTPTKRIISLEGLPIDQAQRFRSVMSGPVRALWCHPVVATTGKAVGAFIVATEMPAPDAAMARMMDHLATVMSTAIEHSTTEADPAHRALHDPLTRLPNRYLLVDRLEQAVAWLERESIALSVLLVDIDRFSTLNDTWGSEIGDRVLLEVAGRLLAAVRIGDTVGRIGSDQYLVMCVATNGELDPSVVARRILRALSVPIVIGDGQEIRITASVGVVVVDESATSAAGIISRAESALRRANAAGRGQFAMYKAELRRDTLDRHETEQALHRAITNDELVIHYQPLVEVRTGYVAGAEALVRWARPGHDLLYPGSFIDIAEESELIVPIGNRLIDQVCADLAGWPDRRGRSPIVTINLSSRQLAVDTLVPTVVSALRSNDLDPHRLGFEITESMEIEDMEAASRNLNQLSELGCRIAIDDFGIGHATLDYLRRFSMADALKLDRSFVAGLGTSREDTAIVHASVALASSLEMQIIAEGVEDLDQLDELEALGCRYAQGYALGRPAPLSQMLEWWEAGRAFLPVPGSTGSTGSPSSQT